MHDRCACRPDGSDASGGAAAVLRERHRGEGGTACGVGTVTCDRDYFKADQTYYDSEKDIIDVCGDSDNPCAGNSLGVGGVPANDSWECVELNNPLNKNEILNSYAIQGVPARGPP